MKAFRFALITLVLLTVAVFVNSVYIKRTTDELAKMADAIPTENAERTAVEFEALFQKFRKAERFISVSVSHDDLTNIEQSFAEIIGAARAGDLVGVITIKSLLKDSLEHLGRLSTFNLDSII